MLLDSPKCISPYFSVISIYIYLRDKGKDLRNVGGVTLEKLVLCGTLSTLASI